MGVVSAASMLIGTQPTDVHRPPEDMFGADDADWAIYRKIVSSFSSVAEQPMLTLLNCTHRIQQLPPQTKKRTLRPSKPSNRSSSRSTPPSRTNTPTLRARPSARR